jgi:beta-lactamase superfamily II metal-dependent hydrolase
MAFTEHNENGILYMASSVIPLRHAFTTRFGGVSEGPHASLNLGSANGDDPEKVRENFRRAAALMGVGADDCAVTRQIHGNTVRIVTKADRHVCLTKVPYDADGIVTAEKGLPLFCFTADCVPALLWDGDTALVIDAGYEDGVLSDFLHRRRLTPDAVVLTHLHADHAMGLRALREDRIPIRVIYLPSGAKEAAVHPDVLALLEELAAEGTEIRFLSAGDTLPLPSGALEVLWPEEGRTRPGQDANMYSLTARLTLKGTSLLHTGDLDGRYEMYAAAPSDLLKVAHHGSQSSSSEAFLASVRPQTALLSCGDAERYARFRERLDPETALFATPVHGLLTVRFEEGGYTVNTFLSPAPDPGPELHGAPEESGEADAPLP